MKAYARAAFFSCNHHWHHQCTIRRRVMPVSKLKEETGLDWRHLEVKWMVRWSSASPRNQPSHKHRMLSEQQRYTTDPYSGQTHCCVFSYLCRFCHQAVGWIPQCNCSAPLWLCLYTSCHSHRCSRRRSLRTMGQRRKKRKRWRGC